MSRDLLTGRRFRRAARAASAHTAAIHRERADTAAPALSPLAAVLLLGAAVFVLACQGLYAHTSIGQADATRALGIAIVVALAALRLLVGNRPSLAWSTLATACGLVLVALAVLTPHDRTATIVIEAATGCCIMLAGALSFDRPRHTTGVARSARP